MRQIYIINHSPPKPVYSPRPKGVHPQLVTPQYDPFTHLTINKDFLANQLNALYFILTFLQFLLTCPSTQTPQFYAHYNPSYTIIQASTARAVQAQPAHIQVQCSAHTHPVLSLYVLQARPDHFLRSFTIQFLYPKPPPHPLVQPTHITCQYNRSLSHDI